MAKPILEIRYKEALTYEQVECLTSVFREQFHGFDILLLDCGATAHIHDDAILNELREIKQILTKSSRITGAGIHSITNATPF